MFRFINGQKYKFKFFSNEELWVLYRQYYVEETEKVEWEPVYSTHKYEAIEKVLTKAKHLAFMILALCLFTGCATYAPREFTDTKGHSHSEYVILDRRCSTYHYQGTARYLDQEYYYACMEQYGYKLTGGEQTGVQYNPIAILFTPAAD